MQIDSCNWLWVTQQYSLNALVDEGLDGGRAHMPQPIGHASTPLDKEMVVQVVLKATLRNRKHHKPPER